MFHRVPFSSDSEIAAVAQGFAARTLPLAQWSHAAHFAAALWFIENSAEEKMPELIRAYNIATGGQNTDTSGYHETITQASLRAARFYRGAQPTLKLFEVCNLLLSSPLGKSDWIFEYWSREHLFSPIARKRWVEPDQCALPLFRT